MFIVPLIIELQRSPPGEDHERLVVGALLAARRADGAAVLKQQLIEAEPADREFDHVRPDLLHRPQRAVPAAGVQRQNHHEQAQIGAKKKSENVS